MLAVRPSYSATVWRVGDGDKYFPSRLSLQSLLLSSPGTSDSILDQHDNTLGDGEDVILTPGTWNPIMRDHCFTLTRAFLCWLDGPQHHKVQYNIFDKSKIIPRIIRILPNLRILCVIWLTNPHENWGGICHSCINGIKVPFNMGTNNVMLKKLYLFRASFSKHFKSNFCSFALVIWLE